MDINKLIENNSDRNILMTIKKKYSYLESYDVTLMLKIIEICCKRGAFMGNELHDIGKLFNKLSKITNIPQIHL